MARLLEDEIAGDPLARGYSGMTDAELLTSLNTANISRSRTSMTGREVKENVDATEYAALTNPKKQQMIELVKRDDLDLFGFDKEIMADIFGSGSTTASNLVTARTELISRAVAIRWGVATMEDLRMHTLSRKVPS